MIVDFIVHGDRQLLEGCLDLGDDQIPDIGWELSFDMVGPLRVAGVTAYYAVAGKGHHRLELAPVVPDCWSAEQAAEFFEAHARSQSGEMTAFSRVELGDYCYCELCPNGHG